MKDYLTLGPTPGDEDCLPAGDPGCRAECVRYRDLLVKKWGIEKLDENNVRISIKSFPHDFGSYMEVCVIFDDDDEKAVNFAYKIENNLPSTWND